MSKNVTVKLRTVISGGDFRRRFVSAHMCLTVNDYSPLFHIFYHQARISIPITFLPADVVLSPTICCKRFDTLP